MVVSQKFKLKLISAKFLLPMISRNELYNNISTLWLDPGEYTYIKIRISI